MMKKTLIAAAVTTAFAGSAIAQVTVNGTIDVSATHTNKLTERSTSNVTTQTNNKNTGGGTGAALANGSRNGWATNEIQFNATEDLGGGLKASARFSNTMANNGFAEREKWVEVSGGFGAVRLGRLNPFTANLNAYSGAGTTEHGGDLDGVTTANAKLFGGTSGLTSGSFQRNAGLVQYSSPSLSGFTVNALYGSNSVDTTTTAGRLTETKMQGIGASYTAGPLKVEFATAERKNKVAGVAGIRGRAFFTNGTHNATQLQAVGNETAVSVGDIVTSLSNGFAHESGNSGTIQAPLGGGNGVSGVVTVAGAAAQLQTEGKHNFQWIGASYNLGPATVMAAHARREFETSTITSAVVSQSNDLKLTSVGVMVPLGAVTLRANGYTGTDSRTSTTALDDVKVTGQQFSGTYSLSKRTYLYGVIGESEIKRDSSSGTAAERKEKSNAIGVVHTF